KIGQNYHLRWFTPAAEIDLCGHATLATAFVIMNFYDTSLDTVCFDTLSGRLSVTREDERYQMTFPSYNLTQV
ncbi:PhzF family phenazine biosynthesis protein, partial [Streptococcus suis]